MTNQTKLEANKTLTVLVTGANSGMGFEASAQLAELGYGRVILACRTVEKSEAARKNLVARFGSDPFATLAVDVSSIASSIAAADELIARGDKIDHMLLNAGIVSGSEMKRSAAGVEMTLAASLIGHHVIANRLLEAGLVPDQGHIVITGSEAARDDLPAGMGMKLYDFAKTMPSEFGDTLHDAMIAFARGTSGVKFNGMRQYGVVKLFTSWWSLEMAERFGDRVSVYTVSPGSSVSTGMGRNMSIFMKIIFNVLMRPLAPLMGLHQPVAAGARRSVDVLQADGQFTNGRSYMSKPKKMIGPMVEQTYPHMLDADRQKAAWAVIQELAGSSSDVAKMKTA